MTTSLVIGFIVLNVMLVLLVAVGFYLRLAEKIDEITAFAEREITGLRVSMNNVQARLDGGDCGTYAKSSAFGRVTFDSRAVRMQLPLANGGGSSGRRFGG